MSATHAPARLAAVLGPTNTGKTHYAIERMLAHRDGMIGLPLRLLAREVYDRVVKAKGKAACALITGEEKIAPETARYFVCTVEAMPLDRRTSFLAVDEIQLARDGDRGHIFTDRILRARGLEETLLLGSDTMRGMLSRLLPGIEILRRERLSTLSYAGARKLTKLGRRTAIVAFSSEEVYAIAELIRRQKGGAAIVMGALSPRTRNAQVGLYQSGEVDVLVATDAIGMGLNMDVDHVAFAGRVKFDGRGVRPLRPDETAQIAGRAGRYTADGAFGETGECAAFDEETIARVENHEFEPVAMIEWRNPHLEFRSVATLLRSLEAPPPAAGLMRARGASDEETLRRLAENEDLRERITRPDDVRRLWDICLTPDFRKSTIDEHARLMGHFAEHLLGPRQRLPQDWIAREVAALDRTDGELDVLQSRLAHIRTWTYAANRPDWLDDCEHWRNRTREIEDRLSDTLHEALTRRFIDRRTSALVRGLKREDALDAGVDETGAVTVEGHFLGRLEGLVFKPDPLAAGAEEKAVRRAAERALGPELERRLRALAASAHKAFSIDARGAVCWRGAVIARALPGAGAVLRPRLALIGADAASPALREAALRTLQAWLRGRIQKHAPALTALEGLSREAGAANALRGLAFQLVEGFGALDRRKAAGLTRQLSLADRRRLTSLGVRIGRHAVYTPALTARPAAMLLATLKHWAAPTGPTPFFPPETGAPAPGRPPLDYAAIGYRPAGPAVVRIDRLERFAGAAWAARRAAGDDPAAQRGFRLTDELAALLGLADPAQAPAVLAALGYRRVGLDETGAALWRPPAQPRPPRPGAAAPSAAAPAAGPFAGLGAMVRRRGEGEPV